MTKITNPILKGFNPDPCICRVGKDYYIATSTFEWFPGVQIHHSKDLVNWELIKRPLERKSQLDMIGEPDSGGVWAPCLTYCDEKFWLIFTDVKSLDGEYKDTHNYLVTCDTIDGKWSDPIYINSSGFDPSLYHEEDGSKWFMNMIWDYRLGKNKFNGITIQEYDVEKKKLIGKPEYIFRGTELGCTEGPHIYKKDGYYYLVLAEGGTSYEHAVTVTRSKNLKGPYEVHPSNPILSSDKKPDFPLQKTGHSSFVKGADGQWYITFLTSRPLKGTKYCPLGRETAIQKLEWRDGWPYIENKDPMTHDLLEIDGNIEIKEKKIEEQIEFIEKKLPMSFQTLRTKLDEDTVSFERDGYLRLYGRESLGSKFYQSLVARRWQSFEFDSEVVVEFDPENIQQQAGMVCYYSTDSWIYLNITYCEERGRIISILDRDLSGFGQLSDEVEVVVPRNIKEISLRVEVKGENINFYYSFGDEEWKKIGETFKSFRLSDDYVEKNGKAGFFTGAFIGLCCQDVSGERKYADFKSFKYLEK